MEKNDSLITVLEACRLWKVSRTKVTKGCRSGVLKSFKDEDGVWRIYRNQEFK